MIAAAADQPARSLPSRSPEHVVQGQRRRGADERADLGEQRAVRVEARALVVAGGQLRGERAVGHVEQRQAGEVEEDGRDHVGDRPGRPQTPVGEEQPGGDAVGQRRGDEERPAAAPGRAHPVRPHAHERLGDGAPERADHHDDAGRGGADAHHVREEVQEERVEERPDDGVGPLAAAVAELDAQRQARGRRVHVELRRRRRTSPRETAGRRAKAGRGRGTRSAPQCPWRRRRRSRDRCWGCGPSGRTRRSRPRRAAGGRRRRGSR